MRIEKQLYELIFPQGTFEYFTVTEGRSDEDNAYITLEEKDGPPLTPEHRNKKIVSRKFHDITITDFPLRGKRTSLTFRRRYWKIEGQQGYLKRDITLTAPGTHLEEEFANFLKEDGGRTTGLSRFYRTVAADRPKAV